MDFNKKNARYIYLALKKNGCTFSGAIGILGNLYAESGLEPKNLQNTYNAKFGMTDEQYTNAVDNGTYTDFVKDCGGYGLAQWTYYTRKQGLLDLAKQKNKSIGDLDLQIEYLLKELKTGYKSVWNVVSTSDSIDECARYFMLNFEKPQNQSESAQKGRSEMALNIYKGLATSYPNQVKSDVSTGIVKWNGIKEFIKGQRVQISKNFVSTEFDCQGKGCCASTPIDHDLINIVQKVRDHFNAPVTVNCGYRCPTHNAQISGASKTSQHMSGKASDIVIKGVHPVRIARYIETISGYKGMIGCYTWDNKGSGFVHVDTRGQDYRGIYTEDNAHCDYIKSFSVNIGKGASGRIVKVVQRFLADNGLYNDKIDGICGDNTVSAITEWNAKHGRPNDSVWGIKCWNESFPS